MQFLLSGARRIILTTASRKMETELIVATIAWNISLKLVRSRDIFPNRNNFFKRRFKLIVNNMIPLYLWTSLYAIFIQFFPFFHCSETIFQQRTIRFNCFGRTNSTILLFGRWWSTTTDFMAQRRWKHAGWKVKFKILTEEILWWKLFLLISHRFPHLSF